ncbi:MAG: transcription elongation factor GreA [Paludibacteraceae bacterium]|jgi:transcription elongation factor GreA|nr:transcription elongation factor GreA [Paludibacteraceae bacterium]OQA48968.1 MAG: Transcription elongation factor GreA [Bacteroidetes bacterium ADurb.Bin302]HOH95598.1 transcription elongation factor GreA [Candidatus Enterocola sp.]HPG55187.1 transcription elongation factor GreA [Candidatus Enterocola sp.]
MATPNYMTEEGYKKLMEEINRLESVERPKISRQIAEARDKGDLSENAEYDAVREAQGLLELKIAQMKATVSNVRIIDETQLGDGTIQILSKVTIKNVKTGQKMTYTLVSEAEANIREFKMAISTPIAKALIGKKKGDHVTVEAPSGIIEFEILEAGF